MYRLHSIELGKPEEPRKLVAILTIYLPNFFVPRDVILRIEVSLHFVYRSDPSLLNYSGLAHLFLEKG